MLPSDKVKKLQDLLRQVAVLGAKVLRKDVEKVIGLLIWFTGGAFWLRPWLSSFYRLCQKPAAVPRLLTIQQCQDLVSQLSPRLAVTSGLRQCDIGAGWVLHSVANSPVSDLSAPGLVAPRLRQGRVSCVLYNFDSKLVVTDAEICFAAQLFANVLRVQAPIPLQSTREDSKFVGAADAYATSDAAGIGGWWLPVGLAWSCLPQMFAGFAFKFIGETCLHGFAQRSLRVCRSVLQH